ncbi:MAG: MauE/DoxX family redox-associated membrane protein [Streptosporangiaceae bacterium]
MALLTSLREVQIPLLAAMLLGACGTKLVQVLRRSSVGEAFGPTAHLPAQLRRPATAALCLVEFGLGAGLILTAGRIGAGVPATSIRLASCVFFVIATCAVIELRVNRPEAGCGCFGDLSTTPVSTRTLARSALLALAGGATIGLPAIVTPTPVGAVQLLAILVVEMVLIGALSPEIGEGLIRLGYSEPCELRDVPSQQTLAALRRSRPWRRYSPLITSDGPADVWRELCWRYVVFPSSHDGIPSDLVFAIYLQQRRPAVRAALVDSATGQTLPWPASPTARGRVRLRYAGAPQLAAGLAATPPAPVRTDIPVSTDV